MKIAVLGFGESGRAAYEFALAKGFEVAVFDERKLNIDKPNFFVGEKAEKFFEYEFDRLVLSPGIKPTHRFVRYALDNGIKVISELEFAYGFAEGKIIAITGTNGKSTTVKLIETMLKESGKKAIACGNYGFAFSRAVLEDVDWYVVEASSFQLEFIDKFKPHIAAILNIAFDHLYWHGSMESYINAKRKIFKNQDEDDFFIKNESDDYEYNGRAKLFVVSKDDDADCIVKDNSAVVKRPIGFIIDKAKLFGKKRFENICFAALSSILASVDEKIIKEVAEKMENLEHRIEFVAEIDGVKFYNDSKATNLDAVENAINSFDESVRLVVILGGKHKGESYAKLMPLLEKRAKAVVVYGEDRKKILVDLEKFIPVPLPALNIWGAIRAAFEVAGKGDVVLFSPGGSSCEPYKNFEERGKTFKDEVMKFKEEYENAPFF
ncbi:UDP-N-acetylmuramoyl-L-alanine--D-glutamate ligase [Hippea alviniae]|uniref:UDP-N-acetylmuramoyl-L-alanine--D-glutamate ligase n=1 Tax=Hippea alviniae TaxID=1279027 RepID=UPI0003B6220C|nr:UDP-N-acetylmuramoyl-L-alanine--D-glutamate ligase [Hippea alviniae]